MSACMYSCHGCLNDAVPNFRMCARCEEVTRGSGHWKLLRVGPQWTSTPPTEPGWYWVHPRANGLIGSSLFVHELGDAEIEFGEFHFRNGLSAPLTNAAHWLRIEAPEVPK